MGSTINACTQGIWLWGEPVQSEGLNIIFLDSEGTDSLKRAENHDGKIFALLILISSIFIFNSKGAIDERAVNQLSLASYLAEILNNGESSTSNPKFIWLLRDFHLELAGVDHSALTSKQYMEDVLESGKSSKKAPKFAEIRDMLFSIFADRDCFTLPIPVSS